MKQLLCIAFLCVFCRIATGQSYLPVLQQVSDTPFSVAAAATLEWLRSTAPDDTSEGGNLHAFKRRMDFWDNGSATTLLRVRTGSNPLPVRFALCV